MISNILMVSVIVALIAGSAVIIPFALGNINYQQPTPTLGNNDTQTVISFAIKGYDFPNLAHTAELVVLGKVIDQKDGGKQGVSTPGVPDSLTHLPTVDNLIQVQKVIKGTYPAKTIDVFTDGDLTGNVQIESDSPDIKKGDHAIFFLRQEPIWGNKWTIVGMDQGKFNVDANGNVHGRLAAGEIKTNQLGLEAKLKDALSKPIPKGQTNDHTKDLTPEEAKVANEKAIQSVMPDTDTKTQDTKTQTQTNNIQTDNNQPNNNQPDNNQVQNHDPEPNQQLNKQQLQQQQRLEQLREQSQQRQNNTG